MSEDKIRQEVLWTRCFTSCLCSWNPCPVLLPTACFISRLTSLKCRHWFCAQVSSVPPFIPHDRFCPRSPNCAHAKVSTFLTYSSLNYISILIFYHVYFCLHNFTHFTHFCTYFLHSTSNMFTFFFQAVYVAFSNSWILVSQTSCFIFIELNGLDRVTETWQCNILLLTKE